MSMVRAGGRLVRGPVGLHRPGGVRHHCDRALSLDHRDGAFGRLRKRGIATNVTLVG